MVSVAYLASLPPVSAGFLLGLFNPEDADDIFLRNIKLSPNCTGLQGRTVQSHTSKKLKFK
jgi:hypothetical protein